MGGSSSGGTSATGGVPGSSSGGTVTSTGGTPQGGTPSTMGGAPTTGGSSGGTSPSTGGGTAGSPGGGGSYAGGGSGGAAGGSGGMPGGSGGEGGGSAGSPGGSGGEGGGSAGAPSGGSDNSGGSGGSPSEPVDCKLPNLPDPGSLTYNNQKLPDPFTFFDGTKVTTKAQWECRRKEILAMADKYLYGPVPPAPDETTGSVNGGNISFTAKVGSKSESFTATIQGNGDVIALELSNGIFPNPRKRLTFGSGFEDKIRNLFGLNQLNPNIANAWMVDRVIDVLEQNPNSGHDPKKMMVSGCSGCGKGAFFVGVFSRIPLTVIVESGGGGAVPFRWAHYYRHGSGNYNCNMPPQGIDNLEDSGICGPWVTNAASWVRNTPANVYKMPFDQHLLLATIAPRWLVHFSNHNGANSWCHLGGTGEALGAWAAKPVWKALGVPERMGFLQYDAGHCSNPSAATSLANEFFKRAFQGDNSANTDVFQTLSNGLQQPVSQWKDAWVDWDMDVVLQ
ncbi:MAG: hypothetical protein DIU78_022975 [Pseudomonadota bacterium]